MAVCARPRRMAGIGEGKPCTVGPTIPWHTNLCSLVPIRKVPTGKYRINGNPKTAAHPSHFDPDMPGTSYATGVPVYTSSFSPPAFILFLISTQVRFVQLANKVFWKIPAHKQTVGNKQAILQVDSGHSSSAEQTGSRSMSCHVQKPQERLERWFPTQGLAPDILRGEQASCL